MITTFDYEYAITAHAERCGQRYSYSELSFESRLNALEGYCDAHDETSILSMDEGDIVDYLDGFGEVFDASGMMDY